MNIFTFGTRPVGTAKGNEVWATVTITPGELTTKVTAFQGWGITNEVTLSGARAVLLAFGIAAQLIQGA